jgi:gliding motility-associated-like protein
MRISRNLKLINGFSQLLILFLCALNQCFAQNTTDVFNTPGTYSWTVPACVTSITVEVWGGGGGGGAVWSRFDPTTNSSLSAEACTAAGGGGGGGYARRTYTVTPGQTYTIVVGSGGIGGVINNSLASNRAQNGSPGGNSTFSGPATTSFGILTGNGGSGGFAANFLRSNCLGGCNINHEGVNGNGGAGGTGANGSAIFTGGNGAAGAHSGSTNDKSGGGGGGAGTSANGGNASGVTTGGTGGTAAGGNGANGIVQPYGSGYLGTNGNNGNAIGGGGSGACGHNRLASSNTHRSNIGGNGARGEVRITYANPASTVPTFNPVNPICSGDPLSPLPSTSTNGITGSWSPALNNTSTTTYTFTPSAGVCASTTTLSITVNQDAVISGQPQNTPICFNSGTATLNVIVNTGPYQWQYFDGTTWSNVVNGTPAGFSYSNATTNALGITTANANCGTVQYRVVAGTSPCQAISNTATITVLKASRITSSGPQCSGSPLDFDACPSGATYSWSVSSPAGTSAIPASGSGQSFSFTSSNNTGSNQTFTVNASITYQGLTCSQTFTPTIVSPPLSGTISGTTSICVGSNSTLTSNGNTGGTWSSSNTNVATVNASGVVTGVSAGTATITYVVNATSPCTGSSSAQIDLTVVAPPNSGTISGSSTICFPGSTTLTSNGNSGGTWSSSNTSVATVNSSGVVTGLAAGTATITYTVSASSPCTTNSSSTFDITVSSGANAGTLSGTTSVCQGNTTTISSNGNTGGTWASSNPAVATVDASGVVTGVSAGTTDITYTVNSPSPCSGSDNETTTVTVIASPNAGTISGSSTICETGTTSLASNGNTGGTWSSSNTAVATVNSSGVVTAVATGTATITYTVNATSPCTTNSSSTFNITITSGASAGTLSGTTSVCQGNTTTISSNGSTGGTWSSSNPAIATVNASGVVTGVSAGTVVISYTTTLSGCSGNDVATISVTVLSGPNAGVLSGLTSLCENATTFLTTNGNPGGTWTSSNNSVLTINSNGVVTAVGPGTATVTYSVTTSPNGCTNSSSPSISTINITINPIPTISVNNPTICSSQIATLIASPSISGGTYAWTPNGQTTASISVSPSITTTYGVIYTANGCSSASASSTVTVNNSSNVSFVADQLTGCAPLTVNLSNTTTGSSNCVWNLGNGQTISGCNASYTFTQVGCYDISLSSISNGCTSSTSKTDYICVESSPIASFNSSTTVFNDENNNVNFSNTSVGADNYIWNFGDGQTSTIENPSHYYTNTSNGIVVQLIAISDLGCIDSTSITIPYEEAEVFWVPNSFTPDADEHNQVFFPVFTSGFDPYNFEMLIFDRWGELVFESHNANLGWDGSYGPNARKAQDGTYTWKISFKSLYNDKRKSVLGHVTLMR